MGRMLTITLFLIIFFLIGVILGIGREGIALKDNSNQMEMVEEVNEEIDELELYRLEDEERSEHFTQKIASFFRKHCNGIL